jgi:hypothetical protein
MICGGCQAERLARAAALADAPHPSAARRRRIIRVRARGQRQHCRIAGGEVLDAWWVPGIEGDRRSVNELPNRRFKPRALAAPAPVRCRVVASRQMNVG